MDNEEEIGLVIQYLKLNKDELENTHMYEGIEYLEKDYQMFEAELINIFKNINVEFIGSKYLIPYNITNMNLRNFFKKIMPNQNEWTQKNFNIKNHACIDFCINALRNLNLKRKTKSNIEKYKKYIFKIIEKEKESKYYEKYKKGFERLFELL